MKAIRLILSMFFREKKEIPPVFRVVGRSNRSFAGGYRREPV